MLSSFWFIVIVTFSIDIEDISVLGVLLESINGFLTFYGLRAYPFRVIVGQIAFSTEELIQFIIDETVIEGHRYIRGHAIILVISETVSYDDPFEVRDPCIRIYTFCLSYLKVKFVSELRYGYATICLAS